MPNNVHSSAKFYLTGVQGIYPVTNVMEIEEVNFNLSKEWSNLTQRPRLCTRARWETLLERRIKYFPSLVKFYLTGVQSIYPVTNFMEMEDVNFNLSKEESPS